MKITFMVMALMLDDGSVIHGKNFEFSSHLPIRTRSMKECAMLQMRQAYYPVYGKVRSVIAWCEERTYY